MGRHRSMKLKLELKSSVEAKPQTLSNMEYQLAWASLRTYVNGNIEEETDSLLKQVEAMKAAEEKPPLPKAAKDGVGTSTDTETSTNSSTETCASTSTELPLAVAVEWIDIQLSAIA